MHPGVIRKHRSGITERQFRLSRRTTERGEPTFVSTSIAVRVHASAKPNSPSCLIWAFLALELRNDQISSHAVKTCRPGTPKHGFRH